LDEIICGVGKKHFETPHVYNSLKFDLEQQLYLRCNNFTRLLATLKLFNLKGNTLPNCNYEVKKILYLMGMEYKEIYLNLQNTQSSNLSN